MPLIDRAWLVAVGRFPFVDRPLTPSAVARLARQCGPNRSVTVARNHRCRADRFQHRIVYTELATQDAWTFTAGAGAPVDVGAMVTIRAQGNIQTNNSEVVRAAVLSGMGIGFSPTWLFEEEMAQGDLQVLLPDWPAPAMPVHLISPSQRRQSAKVKAFADHLAAANV